MSGGALLVALAGCTPGKLPQAPSASELPACLPFTPEVMAGFLPEAGPGPASLEDRHAAIREGLEVPLPVTEPRILLLGSGGHYTRVEYSVVAARGIDGIWTGSFAGGETSLLAQIKPRRHASGTRRLSAGQSAALDAILADPCSFREPTLLIPRTLPGVGVHGWTIEVITQDGRRVCSGHGRLPGGLIGQVWDVMTAIRQVSVRE